VPIHATEVTFFYSQSKRVLPYLCATVTLWTVRWVQWSMMESDALWAFAKSKMKVYLSFMERIDTYSSYW